MADRPDPTTNPNANVLSSGTKPRSPSNEPGFVDGIPVEELVRLTREFTARITNEDRQRVQQEISEGSRSIRTNTPAILSDFFKGKIDLDIELSRRFPSPPLVTISSFNPQPGKRARHGLASFLGQDGFAGFNVEVFGATGDIEVGFYLGGMLGTRFGLSGIPDKQRKRFLELMRRTNGIAFLWSRDRWESDFLIFVVRERFARIYAFSPHRREAACRLTPDALEQLVIWLTGFWGSDHSDDKDSDLAADDSASNLSW